MRHFVILSQQRSGSHWLMNLLNSHPLVHCNSDLPTVAVVLRGSEWAYQQGFSYPPLFPDRTPAVEGKSPHTVGFLVKLNQGLHDCLADRRDLPVVVLRRQNRLATLLSYSLAAQFGGYADRPGDGSLEQAREWRRSAPAVHIAPNRARGFFETWERAEHEARTALRNSSWIELTYEQLCTARDVWMQRVFEHLGVPFHPVSQTPGWGDRKMDPRALHASIANYEELEAHFADTRWSVFFERPRTVTPPDAPEAAVHATPNVGP